ncbi:hypothetical protein [Allobranchiibius huperziae]|uniref:Uncharacterized protein n=1 Tax=Allobranchiibius huperziae TaxID=1874116 RepID=A0A853DBP1_9MICO|nr:hypothetical protein [Allobranchiibius huperziae]NYJ73363.1 hypothetical protein [Allobranchiibius huperziae]
MARDWTVVQCSGGDYYETVWRRWVSFKAVRLGRRRLQRCPIHHRWEMAVRAPEADLTPQIRESAARHRDSGII